MNKSFDCIVSMVIFNNPPEIVRHAAECFINTGLKVKFYVVDNSQTPILKSAFDNLPVFYHSFNGDNIGYGRAHNWAIEQGDSSEYHLILNPDVITPKGVIEELLGYMDANPDVGIICPKVLNRDGSIQHLNKRHPTVFDLFIRRFLPKILRPIFQKRLDRYEMKDIGYDTICNVPFVSGAFMFCRTQVLREVRGFDPRFFLYFEDADLCKTVQMQGYRTLYYPHVRVTHLWERAAHKNLVMAFVFIVNGVRYFNKWGWKIF